MIYALSKSLEQWLRTQGFPLRVVYGPERVTRQAPGAELVVVLERDREQGERFERPKGARHVHAMRMLGTRARIYARSPFAGARTQDHERLCDQVVDAVFVGVKVWINSVTGISEPSFTEARYLRAEELEQEGEQWPGVVYQMRFSVPRGVVVAKYRADGAAAPGAGLPTGTVGDTRNTVEIRRTTDDESGPEIVELSE